MNQYTFSLSVTLSRRTCWVCFGCEVDEPGLEWISPCICRGATKWVHQLCLQQWVDEKQRGSSSVEVSCPQCKFNYQIVYPESSILLYFYECANTAISACSPMILAGATATSLYWISFTYGYTTAAVALGREQSVEFFRSPESSIALLSLPLLPWAILGVKLLGLEKFVLKVWYRIVPALQMLMGKLSVRSSLEQEPIQEFRFVPAQLPILPFLSRSILSTFFLPFIASSIGWALSYIMRSSSTLKRTLLVSYRFEGLGKVCVYLVNPCICSMCNCLFCFMIIGWIWLSCGQLCPQGLHRASSRKTRKKALKTLDFYDYSVSKQYVQHKKYIFHGHPIIDPVLKWGTPTTHQNRSS